MPTAPHQYCDHRPILHNPVPQRLSLALKMEREQEREPSPDPSQKVVFALEALSIELKGGSYRGAKHVDTMAHANLRWQRETNT